MNIYGDIIVMLFFWLCHHLREILFGHLGHHLPRVAQASRIILYTLTLHACVYRCPKRPQVQHMSS